MTEFAHHISWLSETIETIDRARRGGMDAGVRTLLERGRRTCQQILEQNAASELAKETLSKIDALLSSQPIPLSPSSVTVIPNGNEHVPATDEERRLHEKIAEFEERFLAYGDDRFLPLVNALPETDGKGKGLKRALSYPFEAVKANASNPLKNIEVVRRLAAKTGTPWNAMLLTMPDPRHFAYSASLAGTSTGINVAGYAPLGRMMAFDDRMDFSNDMDMMIVIHECLHMPQMNARLMRTPEWFLQFYNVPRPRVIANDEYQTYGLELEGIDLVTGGMLKKAAREKKSVDRDTLMRALGARPDQRMMVEMLRQFSEKFFPDGDAVSNSYPSQYAELIKRMCAHDGYEVFELDSKGALRAV